MSDYSLKKAESSDLPFLEKAESECFADPWSVEMLEEEVNNPLSVFYILSYKSTKIGYFSYLHILDEAHILNVAILPEYQGQGHASELMRSLLLTATSLGCTAFTLEVRQGNVKAISLYEKFGFKLVGVRKGYYTDGENALIYWLYC